MTKMREMASAPSRNQSIDLVKIIAMLGVISLHSNLGKLDNPVAFVLSRVAGVSVPLFFMVSGYLQAGKDGGWRYSFRKIFGIVRYVFICSFACWIVHVAHHLELDFSFVSVFVKSFIQQGPFGMFWYFGAMCLLYILLPFLRWSDSRFQNFFLKLFLLTVCVDFIIFVMTFAFRWEYAVIQPFRIWNWLTYFSLGVIVRRYDLSGYKSLSALIVSMVVFVSFVYFCRDHIGGVEYFFTTPLCMAYAFLLFAFVASRKISGSKVVTELSALFLPVYTIHFFVISGWRHLADYPYAGVVTPLVDYLVVSLVALTVSYLIMKIPFSDRIFRI